MIHCIIAILGPSVYKSILIDSKTVKGLVDTINKEKML